MSPFCQIKSIEKPYSGSVLIVKFFSRAEPGKIFAQFDFSANDPSAERVETEKKFFEIENFWNETTQELLFPFQENLKIPCDHNLFQVSFKNKWNSKIDEKNSIWNWVNSELKLKFLHSNNSKLIALPETLSSLKIHIKLQGSDNGILPFN